MTIRGILWHLWHLWADANHCPVAMAFDNYQPTIRFERACPPELVLATNTAGVTDPTKPHCWCRHSTWVSEDVTSTHMPSSISPVSNHNQILLHSP
jgi:hypothetical protein